MSGLVFAFFILLAGCSENLSWKQRLTVILSTPDGPLEIAAVQEVTLETTSDFYDQMVGGIAGPDGYAYFLQGQAPYVRLPSGQILVVLMMSSGHADAAPGRMSLLHLGDPSVRGPENDDVARETFAARKLDAPVEVPRDKWPYIVILPQNGDVGALRPVNGPMGKPLSVLVGSGYGIERILIEKTSEDVEEPTISREIPCLRKDTPQCRFNQLPREVRITRHAMDSRHFIRRDER